MTSPRYPGNRDIREQFRAATHPEAVQPAPDGAPDQEVPPGPYVHVAEYIAVRRWGQVWPFMKMSMAVYRYARECPGFLAGGIRAKWWRRQFWSYTVWGDRDSMLRFVQAMPHAAAVRRIGEFAEAGSCYVEWTNMSPPDWEEAMQRLRAPTRYFTPPGASTGR